MGLGCRIWSRSPRGHLSPSSPTPQPGNTTYIFERSSVPCTKGRHSTIPSLRFAIEKGKGVLKGVSLGGISTVQTAWSDLSLTVPGPTAPTTEHNASRNTSIDLTDHSTSMNGGDATLRDSTTIPLPMEGFQPPRQPGQASDLMIPNSTARTTEYDASQSSSINLTDHAMSMNGGDQDSTITDGVSMNDGNPSVVNESHRDSMSVDVVVDTNPSNVGVGGSQPVGYRSLVDSIIRPYDEGINPPPSSRLGPPWAALTVPVQDSTPSHPTNFAHSAQPSSQSPLPTQTTSGIAPSSGITPPTTSGVGNQNGDRTGAQSDVAAPAPPTTDDPTPPPAPRRRRRRDRVRRLIQRIQGPWNHHTSTWRHNRLRILEVLGWVKNSGLDPAEDTQENGA